MAPSQPVSTSYEHNHVDGSEFGVFGNIHGDHLSPDTNREPCLRALGSVDPRDEKHRIELEKDKLLKDCYSWIFDNADFEQWMDSKNSSLLWIKGDPGKGKTMMMLGLVDALSSASKAGGSHRSTFAKVKRRLFSKSKNYVAYFFCQSTDSRINNATSVLRSLIYLLVDENKDMIRHVRAKYTAGGRDAFYGINAVFSLRQILQNILHDRNLPPTFLLIDGLDECDEGLEQLIDIITDPTFARPSKVKWLVASRNRSEIAKRLGHRDSAMISLEQNSAHVLKAVETYIQAKVRILASRKLYDSALEETIRKTLSEKSEATFLWVWLAYKRLEKEAPYNAASVLDELPVGLDGLYKRMMELILCQSSEGVEYCKKILRLAAIAYRPLRLQELVGVADLPDRILNHIQYTRDLVERCGSFLTLRQDTIHFIHQSAKDYVTKRDGRVAIDWEPMLEHSRTAIQSLKLLSATLKEDICDLGRPGTFTTDVKKEVVEKALLHAEYACCYWVDHLSCGQSELEASDYRVVSAFLLRHLLHWLEALGWIGKTREGVYAITSLKQLASVGTPRTL